MYKCTHACSTLHTETFLRSLLTCEGYHTCTCTCRLCCHQHFVALYTSVIRLQSSPRSPPTFCTFAYMCMYTMIVYTLSVNYPVPPTPPPPLQHNIEVEFSVWDMAGQEVYYATHQCFLSRNTLYLVVWNMEEKDKGIDYLRPWLLNIQVGATQWCFSIIAREKIVVYGHKVLYTQNVLVLQLWGDPDIL